MKKSEQQKAEDKQRRNLQFIHNSIRNAWTQGQLKTWADVYRKIGYGDESISKFEDSNKGLLYPDLKLYLQKQVDELGLKIKSASSPGAPVAGGKQEPSVPTPSTPISLNTPTENKNETLQTDSSNRPTINNGLGLSSSDKQDKQGNEVKVSTQKESEPSSSSSSESSKKAEEEIVKASSKDYGLIPSPNESVFHYWFQKKATAEIYQKVVVEKKSGVLLLSGTGTGKTFMVAATCRRLRDTSFEEGKTFSHIPYLYLTRTTVVEQAARVFNKHYKLQNEADIEIINIEQMRSKNGQFWIKSELKIINGEEEEVFWWKKGIQPCVVFFDESQAAKNSTSKQHKIMCAYNNLKDVCLISISATPFVKVSEAKCFAVSTHRPLDHLPGFPAGTVLTNENWPVYASIIAAPGKPDEYNEAAIQRLMDDLEPWIVRVKNVRPQFEAVNDVEAMQFSCKEDSERMANAWLLYVAEMAKVKEGLPSDHPFAIMLRFRIVAEDIKAKYFVQRMLYAEKEGYACVAGVAFKTTIIKMVQELERNGVKRDDISLVWGGGQTQLNKKQKAKAKIVEMKDKFEAAGIDVDEMMQDFELDKVQDRIIEELPEHLRLGSQSLDERQKEIDRFQSGKSKFCIFTFKSGGVGLSLHHTDEFTKFKCRRKESGYAVEEDIPLVPVRPRRTFLSPVFSPIELVQGVGRVPRLTSLSNTHQSMLYFVGTIEERVAQLVSVGMRCLSKVVKVRENWMDLCVDEKSVAERVKQLSNEKPDEGGLIEEGDGEE